MDDDKDDKPLFEKAIETVKVIASSVTEAVMAASPLAPTETTIPCIDKNFDAPLKTAEEHIRQASVETQPIISKKNPRKKTASPNLSGRITPTYDFPPPDSPMPSSSKKRKGL
jgi:hypothetical protein